MRQITVLELIRRLTMMDPAAPVVIEGPDGDELAVGAVIQEGGTSDEDDATADEPVTVTIKSS